MHASLNGARRLDCHEAINKSIEKCNHKEDAESCPDCNLLIDLSMSVLRLRHTMGRGVFSLQVNEWLDRVDKEYATQKLPPLPKFERC